MSETFSFNNTGDREASGFKAALAEDLASTEKPSRLRGDEGSINPSEIVDSVKRGAARVSQSAENLHQHIKDSGRMRDDEGSIDIGAIAHGVGRGVDKAAQGVGRGAEWLQQNGNKLFDWATHRDREFLNNPNLSELERSRNALSVIRSRQKSVWSRIPFPGNRNRLDDADVMFAEREYELQFRQHVIDTMRESVNRYGVEYLEHPDAQLQMLQMYANEKALRAQADVASQAARKGGWVGAQLAKRPGLRVGLGIGLMVGGSVATALGIGPAAGMIGAGLYMSSRANIERVQSRSRSKREQNTTQRELQAIMSRNSASGQMVLDEFVQNVNIRDRKGRSQLRPESQAFINNAASGNALPDDIKLMLLQMRDVENALQAGGHLPGEVGGDPARNIPGEKVSGIEGWLSHNEPVIVADIMSQALLSSLETERAEANRQGRGNRYKIAASIGMGAIGLAALGGLSATSNLPETIRASLGMGGFGLAEYLIQRKRKKKK